MAMMEIYACLKCGFKVDAWDDGNPYFETKDGRRVHFYHPEGDRNLPKLLEQELGRTPTADEVAFATVGPRGNESDYLCPDCGQTTRLDGSRDPMVCSKCGGTNIYEIWRCTGKKCPKCGGVFSEGQMGAVS